MHVVWECPEWLSTTVAGLNVTKYICMFTNNVIIDNQSKGLFKWRCLHDVQTTSLCA